MSGAILHRKIRKRLLLYTRDTGFALHIFVQCTADKTSVCSKILDKAYEGVVDVGGGGRLQEGQEGRQDGHEELFQEASFAD